MPAPIALQLYTLRDALAQDFEGVIRQVASIGYAGVEPAGFHGNTPQAAKQLFDELELAVPAAHLDLPIGERRDEILDTAQTLGARYIVNGGLGPKRFATVDLIKEVCEQFNEASAAATSRGMRFAVHNHWWEFEPVEGQYPYQLMMELLDPNVVWEVDTYWVKTAGPDPVAVLGELGARAPLLHIKDGPAVQSEPMVAAGQGTLDIPAIVRAGEAHTEWLIVELDRCATDMLEAVAQSYRYLAEEGLGRGTQG